MIGSIRGECIHHVMVLGETHLRRIMSMYAGYYNEARTHLALRKDAPVRPAIERLAKSLSTPQSVSCIIATHESNFR